MAGQDIITINDIEIFAFHGVRPEENSIGQKFCISAFLYLDVSKAAREDDLSLSVNYSKVVKDIKEYTTQNTFKLIESLACNLADMLLLKYDLLTRVILEVKKPWAPVLAHLDTISVKVERAWHDVYLSIGSNIGDREGYLNNAVNALDETTGIILEEVSDFINTKPVGDVEQDDFLNGAVSIRTIFSPHELLDIIHDIESENGRERLIHWGPRTLDIDILMYDDLVMSDKDLSIPHPEMTNREFVLKPLAKIAPYLVHPISHKTITALLSEVAVMQTEEEYDYSDENFGFEAVDSINAGYDKRIAYFGVEGTYSQQAMELFFGESGYETYSLPKFTEVMEAVERGDADYGVIPIENSSTGGITDLYDHINDYDIYIVGEQIVKIEHALLGLPESTFNDIRFVYSHEQGISQCGSFFEENPYIKPIRISSTAEGARLVVQNNDMSYASIASKRAADIYGLKVLRSCLNEQDNNRTRFVIISSDRKYVKNSKKISISFETKHESGALYKILSHFYHNNLNLEKIESRPIPERNWDYRFFVDIAGNLSMDGVKKALSAINKHANNVNILGNY